MAKTNKDISKRSKANTSVAMGLLESYRRALYSVTNFLDKASETMSTIDDIELQLKVSTGIMTLGEKMGKNIESLDKLEDKVKREEKESITRKGGSETSLFEE